MSRSGLVEAFESDENRQGSQSSLFGNSHTTTIAKLHLAYFCLKFPLVKKLLQLYVIEGETLYDQH